MRTKIILCLILLTIVTFVCSCEYLDFGKKPINPVPTVTINGSLPEMCVHIIDVGQGDAILIDFGNDELLIDGNHGYKLCGYLADCVDGNIEAMVATHSHADHISGLIDVLGVFVVNGVWTNGIAGSSGTYTDFIDKVNDNGIIMHVAKCGDTISVGNHTVSVLNPPATPFGDTNDDSIVLKLVYGKFVFQFEGDAGVDAEVSMRSAGLLSKIDVLKVGHHGSVTASSADFISIVDPSIAVYTAGACNSYGLPDEEIITRLINSGATIYGTDINGSVVICTDGNTINVQIEK
jgi:beta-lactamase superfamily II metal-dependent hydrolase